MLIFGFNELCTELQDSYESLIDLIQKTLPEIWINNTEEETKKFTIANKEILHKTDYTKLGSLDLSTFFLSFIEYLLNLLIS